MSFVSVVRQSCPSKFVNVWKVQVGPKDYLVTPAHVALHPSKELKPKWSFSKFLKDYPVPAYDWRVPSEYLSHRSPLFDLAWAELSTEHPHVCLKPATSAIVEPTSVQLFFRQPYDLDGKWIDDSSFAATDATLYPSPGSGAFLLEAIDIGFRGLSGAMAVDSDGKYVGIFVKRAVPLGLKVDVKIPPASREPVPVVHSAYHRHASATNEERSLMRMEERIAEQISRLETVLYHMQLSTLKKSDLVQILNVVALRRGLFIPSSRFVDLMSGNSISVSDVMGKCAS